jgi:tyrosyl-tRNA synthetase
MDNVIEVLEERGILDAMTSLELKTLAANPNAPLKVYCGFDPSADSLHLGNMVAIMGLAWFQRYGHTPIAIVGGATGMIGDPSGRSSERNLLDEQSLMINQEGIKKNIEKILLRDDSLVRPVFLNNYDWFKNFTFLSFLRDIGKHFRINVMLSKDSVKGRLESEEGLSFTEFSYQILQGYDFYHLYKNYGVTLQLGGSDQWGNITAGIDLVRKLAGEQAYGLTFSLLTKSDGQKFGKSEKGAIWLSEEKLSVYEFYQYLFRVADVDVIRLLKMLTFLELEEINEIEQKMERNELPPNSAQRILAEEVTRLVHGSDGVAKALSTTQSAMPGKAVQLNKGDLEKLMNEIPSAILQKSQVFENKLLDVVSNAKFVDSKGEVRRLIRNGGLWLNNKRIVDENYTIIASDAQEGEFLVFAFGKKHKTILKVI